MHDNTQKNNSDKGVQERLHAHSRSGRLQDERERERRREEEKRAVVSGLTVNRAAAASLQPRGSLPTVDTRISVFYVSRRLLIGNLWTWNLAFTSGFKTCPRYLDSGAVLDFEIQDLFLTPGFWTCP